MQGRLEGVCLGAIQGELGLKSSAQCKGVPIYIAKKPYCLRKGEKWLHNPGRIEEQMKWLNTPCQVGK